MESKLQERCELFDQNNNLLLKKYWARMDSIVAIASILFTDSGKLADIDELEEAKAIIKDKFGIFSNTRSYLQLPLMSNMVISGKKEEYIDDVNDIYKKMVDGKLFHSEFELLAAMVLYEEKDNVNVDEVIEKVKTVYKKMRSNHPILTDRCDMASATMLALKGGDEDALLDEMEKCYDYIKPRLGVLSGEEAQTMAAILAIIDEPVENKCSKAIEIIEEMRRRKMPIKHRMNSPIVGGLVAIDKPVNEIVDELEEIYRWLKGKKGFGAFNLGREGRVTYAMMLSLGHNASSSNISASVAKSTLVTIAIVEIMVMMMIIISSSHHSSSSSSSSSH